jgi:hypothetical protein
MQDRVDENTVSGRYPRFSLVNYDAWQVMSGSAEPDIVGSA